MCGFQSETNKEDPRLTDISHNAAGLLGKEVAHGTDPGTKLNTSAVLCV